VPSTHLFRAIAKRCLVRTETRLLMPFANILLIMAMDLDKTLFTQVLAPHIRRDRVFAHRCYWYSAARPSTMARKMARQVLEHMEQRDRDAVRATGRWVTTIRTITDDFVRDRAKQPGVNSGNINSGVTSGAVASTGSNAVPVTSAMDRECLSQPVLLPGRCDRRVCRVFLETMKVLGSASVPVSFQVRMMDVGTGKTTLETLMVKRDEHFWNDVCVMNIHEHVGHENPELQKYMNLYHVCPLSPSCGLVQFIRGAESLFNLRQKRIDISRHIVKTAPQSATVGSVRKCFRRSVAFSSVMGLMCGYADRHLGNLVVSRGVLTQIDFGFLLSREPGTKRRFLPAPHRVRLTPELLDIIETDNSDNSDGSDSIDGSDSGCNINTSSNRLSTFLQECTSINKQLRSSAHAVYFMLYPLCKTYVSTADIVLHLRSWILPGSEIRHADAVLKNQIRTATARTTSNVLVSWFLDEIHKFGQTIGT
jgi:hypothetical protein